MTLMSKHKCPDGKHLMEGLHCIVCGEVVIPPGLNKKRETPRDIQEEVDDVCQRSQL